MRLLYGSRWLRNGVPVGDTRFYYRRSHHPHSRVIANDFNGSVVVQSCSCVVMQSREYDALVLLRWPCLDVNGNGFASEWALDGGNHGAFTVVAFFDRFVVVWRCRFVSCGCCCRFINVGGVVRFEYVRWFTYDEVPQWRLTMAHSGKRIWLASWMVHARFRSSLL